MITNKITTNKTIGLHLILTLIRCLYLPMIESLQAESEKEYIPNIENQNPVNQQRVNNIVNAVYCVVIVIIIGSLIVWKFHHNLNGNENEDGEPSWLDSDSSDSD